MPVSAAEFVARCLCSEIERMLAELGNPPLITRIFPHGWRNEPESRLRGLYELCRRTYDARAKE